MQPPGAIIAKWTKDSLFLIDFLEVFFVTYGMSRNYINWITAKIYGEILAESLQLMNT